MCIFPGERRHRLATSEDVEEAELRTVRIFTGAVFCTLRSDLFLFLWEVEK